MPTRYRNPVYPGTFADPFVRPESEGYLAFGTGAVVGGRVFEILASPDLGSWRSVGGGLLPLPAEAGLGTDYWAPEVAFRDGRWWMYYSVGHGDRGHHLRVAVADSPVGPYRDQGLNLTPQERFSIDPSPFQDDDGSWYLFYARDDLDGDRVGTMLAVGVLTSPTAVSGRPRSVLRPSADWQLYARQRPMYGQVYDWHTLEGPFVRKRDGRYYCFYSGGSWQEPSYGVACAVAEHPLGPWRDLSSGPLLQTIPGRVIGPGHNSVVTGPGGGDVMVYHAWDVQHTARRMCIDPIEWGPDGPRLVGPTWEVAHLP